MQSNGHSIRRNHAWQSIAAHPLACFPLVALVLLTGCHHQPKQAYRPPPPQSSYNTRPTHTTRPLPPPVVASKPPDTHGHPSFTETGMASWYGAGKRNADGSPFDKNAMTAAHKTLPLGTTLRVTNLANNEQVIVRVADRGPFVHGRVLDLSEGAAKKIDLYRMGVAKVKIEAFTSGTAAINAQGKWCVQTGAFKTEEDALDLKAALVKRYAGSRVTEFSSSTGFWVRIDPPHYDHTQAEAILEWIGSPDPKVVPFLVRLD